MSETETGGDKRARRPSLPLVSVIIPVLNDREPLTRCLQAIDQQSYPQTLYEVILADNGSREPYGDMAARFPCVKRIVVEPQPGSYAARNTGIRASHGGVVAFTDADCIPEPPWLESAVTRLLALSKPAVVAGRVAVVAQNPQRPTVVELYDEIFWLRQEAYAAAGFAATANLVTYRNVLERVGYFDPLLKSGGDAEWGQRARSRGIALAYAPDAVVRHPARRSVAEVLRKGMRVSGGHVQIRLRAGYAWRELARDAKADLGRVSSMYLQFREARPNEPLLRRLRMAILIVAVQIVRALERVRLFSGGKPRRR